MSRDHAVHLTGFDVETFAHAEGCRAYLLVDDASRRALAIDPRADQVQVIRDALARQGATLAYVLDTHTHADHFSGAHELATVTGAVHLAHPRSKTNYTVRPCSPPTEITLGATRIRLIEASGHTPDSLAVVAPGHVFTGDALFVGGAGRTDFPGGSPTELFETFRRIDALPAETVVHPGHVYGTAESSTLAAERQHNPLFAEPSRDALVAKLAGSAPLPPHMASILEFNLGHLGESEVISVETFEVLRKAEAITILDVRTPAEYESEHVPGSLHIELGGLEARMNTIPDGRLVAVVCRSGARARDAANRLLRHGHEVTVLDGGLNAWRREGGRPREGTKSLALDRQVQLTIGAGIVLGSVLGWLVHPAWFGLPAFFGAGLLFAGLSGTCGLALLLARMPWNRRSAKVGAFGVCAAPVGASNPNPTCAAPGGAPNAPCAAPIREPAQR
ncbi:MAG: MBL fold metallo-hydrolase [Planctomycetes bacterium]|nr:MBL fold metallo-hydrolase [Planctomycetota bacterium]MCC7168935.1 MBL fold metallo-hydrolase [Planctomycetota bacterium]